MFLYVLLDTLLQRAVTHRHQLTRMSTQVTVGVPLSADFPRTSLSESQYRDAGLKDHRRRHGVLEN